jgi:hypothetical protein
VVSERIVSFESSAYKELVQPSPWQELSNLAKYKQSEIKGKSNYINTEESLLKEL